MNVKLSPSQQSAPISSSDSQDDIHKNLLSMVHTNKTDRIEHFLEKNPSFNVLLVADGRLYTLLHIACLNNNINICQRLFTHIQNLNLSPQNVKRWVNSKTDEGFTALHFASFKGSVELIKLLEVKGADINAVNYQGLTVVHLAAQGDQPVSIAYFQSKGLSIHAKDNKGSSPLHWAAYLGMENATNYLTSWGCQPNATDNDTGLTPLHLGVVSGNPRIVRRLLLKGANKSLQTTDGKIALDFAKEHDNEKIIHLLGNPNWFLNYLNIKPGLERRRTRSSLVLFFLIFGITLGANVCFVFPFIDNITWIVLFGISTFLTFFFFLFAWLTNPGYMKNSRKADILPLLLNHDPHLICPDCVIVKPLRSKHCDYCNSCVSVQDHHCPWINNCIGSRNLAYFVFFTFFALCTQIITFLISVFYIGLFDAPYTYFPFFKYPRHEILYFTKNIVCGANFLSALIFLIPLFVLNYVQLGNIFSGKTTSERYGYSAPQENLNETTNQSFASLTASGYSQLREERMTIRKIIDNCKMMCCLNRKDNRYNHGSKSFKKFRNDKLSSDFSP